MELQTGLRREGVAHSLCIPMKQLASNRVCFSPPKGPLQGSTPVYCWQGHWTIEGTLYSHHTQTCISHASFKTACTCTHTHTHTHTQFWTVSMARKLTFLFLNVYIHVKDTRLYRFPANYPGNMRFPARKRRESEELSNEEAQGTRYCRHKAIVITAKAFMSTNDSITTVAMLGQ